MLEIVANFIDQSKQNLRLLQENLARYKDIFQYVYSHVFPEVYTVTEKRGVDLKSNFHVMFKTYRDKMMLRQQATAKNIENYEKERQDTCEFEQKLVKTSVNSATVKNNRSKNGLKSAVQPDVNEQKSRKQKN